MLRKKNKKAGNKEENKDQPDLDDSFEGNQNDGEDARPDCLFYRLLKFILRNCPGMKNFIDLMCVYMFNRIFIDKAFSEPDESFFKSSRNNEEGGNFNPLNDPNLLKKRDGIVEFVNQMVDKLISTHLDIEDPSQRKFEMPRIESRKENMFNFQPNPNDTENREGYRIILPFEVQFFLEKSIEIIKKKYKNESRVYLMYSKVLELIFEEVLETIERYQFDLIKYVKQMDGYRKIKQDITKIHLFNLRNVFELFISYIAHKDAFVNNEVFGPLFDEVNIELRREARTKIEQLYFSLIGEARFYRPEFVLFQKLVTHSFDHQGIKMNISCDKFLKLYELCETFPKIIFGREESDFDILFNKLKEFKFMKSFDIVKENTNKIQLELRTKIFAEPFTSVKRCLDCNSCLSNKYSQPAHKNLISSFLPSDPTSLHSIYSSLLRIPEINGGQYQDMQAFLEDGTSHQIPNPSLAAEIKQSKGKIKNFIKKGWERYEEGKEDMTELEFADKIHSENYHIIEEEIKRRNSYLSYLIGVYVQMCEIEKDIEIYKKDFTKAIQSNDYVNTSNDPNFCIRFSHMKDVYDKIFSNYQFGCANPKLESFSSINTSLKFTRKIFSKSNKAIASKELFENLTNEQKKDLKSFYKLRFAKLLHDKTIVNLNRMPELKSISNNLRLIFFEDEDFNVQGQVLFKDRPTTAMCGKTAKTKTSILLQFTITQEDILVIMKKDPTRTVVYGDVLEFNVGKLTQIISQLFRARTINK